MWKLNWTELGIDLDRLKEVLTYDAAQPMIFSSGFFLLALPAFENSVSHLAGEQSYSTDSVIVGRHRIIDDGGALEAEDAGGVQLVYQPRAAMLFQVHQFLLRNAGSVVERTVRAAGHIPSGRDFFLYLPVAELYHRRVPA